VIVLLEMRMQDGVLDLGGGEVVDEISTLPHLGSVMLA
jgi:hypothetical protein